jgi:5-methylcytosine-specific restriction endonuclease McrA
LPEENQDSRLAAYTDAARADSIQDLQYRHEELLNEFISHMPDLKLKDKTRNFTEEQRRAIFWKQKGTCQICGRVCRENEFHADHVLPWSKGNPTSLENGQVLCTECNLKKGNRG